MIIFPLNSEFSNSLISDLLLIVGFMFLSPRHVRHSIVECKLHGHKELIITESVRHRSHNLTVGIAE
jgi:hypothetical protein